VTPFGWTRRPVAARGRLAIAIGLLAAAAGAAVPVLAQRGMPPAIRVVRPDPEPVERIPLTVIDNVRYVSTNDLARVFGATKYWRPEIQKLSLRIGEHTLRFTVDAPVVLVDEGARNLAAPVKLVQGVVFAPEATVGLLFEWGLVPEATFDEADLVIRFRAEPHAVRQAQLYSRSRVTEVAAALSKSLPARILYATPTEIRVLLEGGSLDSSRVFSGGVVADGWMREVVGGVECRLALTEAARGWALNVSANRLRLAVTDDQGLVDAGLFNPLESIRLGGADRRVRTIVLDPGHGGADKGATLPGGQVEKDVALDVARALRSALQSRLGGVRVILTRESDQDLPPSARAAIANGADADLFISIHLDNEGAVRGGGFRVLTFLPATSPSETPVAPIAIGGGDRVTELMPWRGAQMNSAGASMALGQSIADALRTVFPASPTLIVPGRIGVLEPISCPAIILESAPSARSGPEAMSPRSYTIFDYTQTVARAIEEFVRHSNAT
jgi:N-acetylmuramoyl-L-alanine amidase